jgi:hypothetical protein
MGVKRAVATTLDRPDGAELLRRRGIDLGSELQSQTPKVWES